jgi:hypothetical protein
VSLSTEQLCDLLATDSVDWKCHSCAPVHGGKKKRISVILPNHEDEDSETEGSTQDKPDKALLEMRQEIRQLRQTAKEIIRDELQSTLGFYSDNIDEYENKLKDHEMRFKILENHYKDIINTCKNLFLKN